jgi:hypothetical protein
MRASLKAALIAGCALLLCTGARAEQPLDEQDADGPTIGIGLICNTPEQAEQFVTLQNQGRDPAQAIAAVNKQANNPRACGVAAVAFIRDKTVTTRTVQNRLVQVVRINVVAGFNGDQWHSMPAMIQYAVIESEGGDSI